MDRPDQPIFENFIYFWKQNIQQFFFYFICLLRTKVEIVKRLKIWPRRIQIKPLNSEWATVLTRETTFQSKTNSTQILIINQQTSSITSQSKNFDNEKNSNSLGHNTTCTETSRLLLVAKLEALARSRSVKSRYELVQMAWNLGFLSGYK